MVFGMLAVLHLHSVCRPGCGTGRPYHSACVAWGLRENERIAQHKVTKCTALLDS